MKKKNVLTIVIAIALVAALAVGATLAYFTSSDAEQNTFTMGNVKINLKESNDGGDNYVETGLSYNDVMPGNTENKLAKVDVLGTSQPAYIRVTAKVSVPADTTLTEADIASLTAAVKAAIGTAWTVTEEADGTLSCIYNAIAQPNDSLTLFSTISIPTTLGNNAAGQEFTIDLNAYAVQSANVDIATFDWNSVQ